MVEQLRLNGDILRRFAEEYGKIEFAFSRVHAFRKTVLLQNLALVDRVSRISGRPQQIEIERIIFKTCRIRSLVDNAHVLLFSAEQTPFVERVLAAVHSQRFGAERLLADQFAAEGKRNFQL